MSRKFSFWIIAMVVVSVYVAVLIMVMPNKIARLTIAAEFGFSNAQHELGFMYASGVNVEKSGPEAVKWLSKAAMQGDRSAQFYTGFIIQGGDGVAQNTIEAARWYTMAAQQGYEPAQDALGEMYAAGVGVEKDVVEAYMWLDLAAVTMPCAELSRNALAKTMRKDEVVKAKERSASFKPKSWAEIEAHIPEPRPDVR